MNKKPKPLMIYEEVYNLLKKKQELEQPDSSFSKWATDYLLMRLEKDEFLTRYAPYLEKVAITDNRITIRDNRLDKIGDVYFKDDDPYCTIDESHDCIHTHFALALPEIAKISKNIEILGTAKGWTEKFLKD